MRRRDFIAAVVAGVALAPATARGQTSARPLRIGELHMGIPDSGSRAQFGAMRQQLRELGYLEGQSVVFETRYASGQRARLDELARELIAWPADIIFAANSIVAIAAKRATSKIPIVMVLVTDAVGQGLVSSLARPGGNVTGLTTLSAELAPKRLELLKEVVPGLPRVALFVSTTSNAAAAMHVRDTEEGARALGIPLDVHDVPSPDDLEGAFAAVVGGAARAIVISVGTAFQDRARMAALAKAHRLPVMFTDKSFPHAGGLLSYGPSYIDLFRRAAFYIDKIAKGASPAELPVEQPSTFELVVNLKAAKAVGISFPQSVLARADEVIE